MLPSTPATVGSMKQNVMLTDLSAQGPALDEARQQESPSKHAGCLDMRLAYPRSLSSWTTSSLLTTLMTLVPRFLAMQMSCMCRHTTCLAPFDRHVAPSRRPSGDNDALVPVVTKS